jgi:N-acetylglucosaminyl-diphospho-decaprenol L-rhamnosyltransferase
VTAISLVTVTHNSSQVLEPFLTDLRNGREQGDEIVVVDSGSGDAGESRAIAERQMARFIGVAENVGYGGGSNIGAATAGGEWVAIVNPDVTLNFAALHALVDAAIDAGVACLGPGIAEPDGTPVENVRASIRPPWHRGKFQSQQVGGITLSESISGCCMVMPAQLFSAIGGFDTYFFMFAEEVDLQKRIREDGGLVGVLPRVTVVTPGGGSSSVTTRRWGATERHVAHIRFVGKHFSRPEAGVDLLWRSAQVLLGSEYSPRLTSLKQLWAGAFKSRSL